MEKGNYDRRTFFLAKIAIVSFLLAIGAIILFCLLISLGMDFGIFVLLFIIFSYTAFFSGLLSTIIIIFFRHRFKGFVYSIISLVSSFPIVYVQTEFFTSPNVREEMKKTHTTLYNMELLAKELKTYAQNHNGYFPDANNWCDALISENPDLTVENFKHPEPNFLGLKGKCHIAFNKELGAKLLSEISPETILLFEADGDWNLNGTKALLESRYGEKDFVRVFLVNGSEYAYWYDKKAIRKFKSKFGGRASMYYEQPRWAP